MSGTGQMAMSITLPNGHEVGFRAGGEDAGVTGRD